MKKESNILKLYSYNIYMLSFVNKKRQFIENEKKRLEILNFISEKKEKIKNNIKIFNDYVKINIPYVLKDCYNSIIPLHFYTCWHTKELPQLMRNNYDNLVSMNPEFQFHLYDENECIQFIKDNFDTDVLDAYNTLIPCSYKSDLWRFCILYVNGGIYMDIKYGCVNNFKFIALTEKEYFVRDYCIENVYTALIVTLPKNEIMKKCIYKIVENVKNRFYGEGCLDPTGPQMLGRFFRQDEKNNLELYHNISLIENKLNKFNIVFNDRIILSVYDAYREEQKLFQKNNHYSKFWDQRNIYY